LLEDVEGTVHEYVPIAACNIDAGQDYLVRQIVHIEKHPTKALIPASQVDLIEDDDVDEIHNDGASEQIGAKCRPDNKGYWEYERREKIEERFIDLQFVSLVESLTGDLIGCSYLLEYEDLSSKFPPTQPPTTKNIVHIVPHSVYKKKVPSLETLLEDCHLTKPAPRASARNKDGCRGLRFYKNVRAHLDSTSKLTSHVTKEPVLRYAEARMLMEGLNK
jgi:hypothetical protein